MALLARRRVRPHTYKDTDVEDTTTAYEEHCMLMLDLQAYYSNKMREKYVFLKLEGR